MKAAVIGAGLAGCEAAKQLSRAGIPTYLYEMKPKKFSPAHKNENFAELVCSNSLKAERLNSAAGLLKAEMEMLSSVCVEAAKRTRVPAGGALSVDRDRFSALITENIKSDKNITVINEEVSVLPDADVVIVAAGPLASDALTGTIHALCGDGLSFYDAAAPIVSADSVDMEYAFTQSRYDRGGSDDYINCPMNKEQYEAFYEAIINAESAETHSFDKRHDVYEGCMPIEVLASRGKDTMRFGPLKPVGLRDPRTGHRPWANLQLRRENSGGTMYNLVGFQTNLKFGEQKRVFSMFPVTSRCGISPLRSYAQKHVYKFTAAFKRLIFSALGQKNIFCRSDNRSRGLYGIGLLRNYGGAERRKVPFGKRAACASEYHRHRCSREIYKR